jgi:hypothetical protein
MVCSKCNKDIPSGKETKIEKSIICRKCYDKIVARCHNCYEPIYTNDLIYTISVSWGAEYIVSANETRNIIQCVWCHQKLKNGKKKENKLNRWWRKQKKWILGSFVIVCVVLLLIFGLPLFNKDLVENWNKTCLTIRCLLIILLFIIPITILYLIVSEFNSGDKRQKK